jgi:hypothetical protein
MQTSSIIPHCLVSIMVVKSSDIAAAMNVQPCFQLSEAAEKFTAIVEDKENILIATTSTGRLLFLSLTLEPRITVIRTEKVKPWVRQLAVGSAGVLIALRDVGDGEVLQVGLT